MAISALALSSITFSSTALSFPIEVGKITQLLVHQAPNGQTATSQRYILRLDGSINTNNCGTDGWSGLLVSDADKATYATLLSLMMSDKTVKIQGTDADTCLAGNMLIRNVYSKW